MTDTLRVWWCGYRQSTASPDDWMEATYDWHGDATHMIGQRMEDVLPWCPICKRDGGLPLTFGQPGFCGWVELRTVDR